MKKRMSFEMVKMLGCIEGLKEALVLFNINAQFIREKIESLEKVIEDEKERA